MHMHATYPAYEFQRNTNIYHGLNRTCLSDDRAAEQVQIVCVDLLPMCPILSYAVVRCTACGTPFGIRC